MMKYTDATHMILLVLGCIMFVKALWAVISPASVKKTTTVMTRLFAPASPVVGTICVVFAVVLWALVFMHQPISHWLLILLGVMFLWVGTFCLRKRGIDVLATTIIIDRRKAAVRAMGLMAMVAAALIIWVALRVR